MGRRNEVDTNANFLCLLFSYFIRVFLTPLHKEKGELQKAKWLCHQKPSPHWHTNTRQCKRCLFIKSSYLPGAKHTLSFQTILFQCFEVPSVHMKAQDFKKVGKGKRIFLRKSKRLKSPKSLLADNISFVNSL